MLIENISGCHLTMEGRLVTFFSLVFLNAVFAGDLCSKSVTVGDTDFKKHSDHLDELSGVMYLVKSAKYRIPCCGLIRAIKSNTRINGDVRFLVWRPTDIIDQYLVAGDFKIEIETAPKAGSVLPSGSLQLQVQEGDIMGWYVPGESSIPYTDGKIDGHVYLMSNAEKPNLGDIIDFSKATKKSKRIYAIAANLDEDTKTPEFKGMSTEVRINTDYEVGTSVVRINVFDPQLQDTVVSVSPNPYFEISSDGRSLILKASPEEGVYDVVLTSLSICGLSASTEVTITVEKVEIAIHPPPPPTTPLLPPLTETAASIPKTTTTTTTTTKAEVDSLKTATSPPLLTTAIAPPAPITPSTPPTPINPDVYDTANSDGDDASPALTDALFDNATTDDFILFTKDSQTSLWMVLAGLSASTVLLVCNLLIFRYAWKMYGGRFRPKTASEPEKTSVPSTPNKDKDPEVAADGDCTAPSVDEKQQNVHTCVENKEHISAGVEEGQTIMKTD